MARNYTPRDPTALARVVIVSLVIQVLFRLAHAAAHASAIFGVSSAAANLSNATLAGCFIAQIADTPCRSALDLSSTGERSENRSGWGACGVVRPFCHFDLVSRSGGRSVYLFVELSAAWDASDERSGLTHRHSLMLGWCGLCIRIFRVLRMDSRARQGLGGCGLQRGTVDSYRMALHPDRSGYQSVTVSSCE